MWFDLEKKLKEDENKRIKDMFKQNEFSKEEIRIYCAGYSDALLYSKHTYIYKAVNH